MMPNAPFYAAALHEAIAAAHEGGAMLRAEFHRAGGPRGSSDDHANIDIEVERVLRARLLAAFPGWAFRGEETGAVPPPPGDGPIHCWLVDPNDGTRAFLSGVRGSSVSIGLLRDGVPVLGVVYAPSAPDDAGDLIAWAEDCGPVRRNGVPVERTWPERLDRHTVMALSWSVHRASGHSLWTAAPGRYRDLPSIAYRLALVAVGEADATISTHGTNGWDYGAGHALLRGAGGTLVDHNGSEVTYSADGASKTRGCFGGPPPLLDDLRVRMAEMRGRDHRWHRERESAYGRQDTLFPSIEPAVGAFITDPGVLARAHGTLLGQLAGDSLGSLVEFATPPEIARRYPGGLRDLDDGGTWGTIAGQATDDSELALMLARLLARRGDYGAEPAAQVYAWWLGSHPFDVGGTTRQALGAIRDRDLRNQTAAAAARVAANPESQANGSLMRTSPLGVFAHALTPGEAAALARADSALTHPHIVCQEACAVYTVAVAHAVGTGAPPAVVYAAALAWAEANCRAPEVLATLKAAEHSKPADFTHQQGWVLIALQNAFWQLLHAPTLEEGIVDTVEQGGDTDTTAAIAGALLGAVYGREAVPLRWRRLILSCRPVDGVPAVKRPRPADFWGVDLLELAERLAAVGRLAADPAQ